jgi:hypothetical protein
MHIWPHLGAESASYEGGGEGFPGRVGAAGATSLLLGRGSHVAGEMRWHSRRGWPMRNADLLAVELIAPELILRLEPQQLWLFPYSALIAVSACLLGAGLAPAFQLAQACQYQLDPLPFLVT